MRPSGWTLWSITTLVLLGIAGIVAAESETKTVQVSATILPRLELSVSPETGQGIAFGDIEQPAPGDQTRRSVKVNVGVFSNLGRPYQVTQTVRRPLTDDAGISLAQAQFEVTTSDAALGMVAASEPLAIVPGDTTTLYTSNSHGKSDAFNADYTLTVTPTTPDGTFETEIVYTVTSL